MNGGDNMSIYSKKKRMSNNNLIKKDIDNKTIYNSLEKNIERIKKGFKGDPYFVNREINVSNNNIHFSLLCYDGMVDTNRINEYIIKPIQINHKIIEHIELTSDWHKFICNYILNISSYRLVYTFEDVIKSVIEGQTCLLLEGSNEALILDTTLYEKRSISPPEMEPTLYGSRETFTEDLKTNLVLLRRKLKSPTLTFKQTSLGTYSKSDIRIIHIDGIAKDEVVNEVYSRIDKIEVDHIYDTSMIGQLIDDNPVLLLPQHTISERPDIVVTHLLEGRIAILCDGFPSALIIPYFISQELKTIDDYSQGPIIGSILILTRYLGIILSTLVTPLYLSFVAYNHTIIPPDLALHISSGREFVPFPSFIEVIIMTISIDLLRETGLRLPKAMGSTVSLLGAVVIGQAAVQAGYISPSLIIVIAISGFSSFLIPSISLGQVVRIINYVLIIFASILGLYGVLIGVMIFIWLLMKYSSFNTPIAYPFGSGDLDEVKDSVIREPACDMKKRPNILVKEEAKHIDNDNNENY